MTGVGSSPNRLPPNQPQEETDMTQMTLFNPAFRRLFADPFFDLPVRHA